MRRLRRPRARGSAASKPHTVLLDLHMPEMSGLEVLSRLHEQCPGLPVILITGDEHSLLGARCKRPWSAC